MKKKNIIVLLLGMLCCFPLHTTAQTKSAAEIWQAYQQTEDLYTFIDGLTASDSPKSFIPYIPELIEKSVYKKIETDILYEEMVESILPKCPEAGIFWGLSLCKEMQTIPQIFKVLNALPKDKINYYNGYTSNKELRNLVDLAGENNDVDLAYRPEIRGVVILPGGKIFIKEKVYDLTDDKDGLWKYASCGYEFANQIVSRYSYPTLMYDPNGTCYVGYLRKENGEYSSVQDVLNIKDLEPEDKVTLWLGFKLDKNANKTGEKAFTFNSFADIKKNADAYDNKEKEQFVETMKSLNKQLIAKYGSKAFVAMCTDEYYVGLPEGAVSGFRYCWEGKVYHKYTFSGYGRDRNGTYKIYKLITGIEWNGYMPAIYVRNGKVIAWK